MKSQSFKRPLGNGQSSRAQGAAPNLGRVSRMHAQEIAAQLSRQGTDPQGSDLRGMPNRTPSLLGRWSRFGRWILIVMTLILAACGIALCWWVLRADATLALLAIHL